MKKRLLVALASVGMLAAPTCLNIDQAGLVGLGEDLLCEVVTSGLPFSGSLDYCAVIDIDLPIDEVLE